MPPQTKLSVGFPFISTRWGPGEAFRGLRPWGLHSTKLLGPAQSPQGRWPTYAPSSPLSKSTRTPGLRAPPGCVRARPQTADCSTKGPLCARSAPSPLAGLPDRHWSRVVASAPQGCRGRLGGGLAQKTNPAVSRFLQREPGQVGPGGSGATAGTNGLAGGAGHSPHRVTRPLAPLPPALLSQAGLSGRQLQWGRRCAVTRAALPPLKPEAWARVSVSLTRMAMVSRCGKGRAGA